MPITDLLERNSKLYGEEIALVEINPEIQEAQRVTWKEYELIQPTSSVPYRRAITWSVFDEKANRVANMLLGRGIRKGQKVAILLMNCLEWLPIYFGILKAGAIAVPLNFRYTSDEIDYCLKLADVDVLFFGPEFIGRVEAIVLQLAEYHTAVKDLEEALAIDASRKRVQELEHTMSRPGFYDDAELSKKVFDEVGDLKGKLTRFEKLQGL